MIEVIFNSGTTEEVIVPSSAIERFEIFNSDNAYYQSAHLLLHGISFTPEINDTLQIYINDSLEFNGYVSRVNKDLAGTHVYKIQAIGKTYDLKRFYVSEATYENVTSAYIASSLVTNFTTLSGTFINPTEGVLIDSISFKNKTVLDCLSQLTKVDGYKFYVDNNDNVHYYKVVPSSVGIFTDNDILKIIELEISDDRLYNDIHLTGGEWYSNIIDYSATPTDRVYISSTNEQVAIRIDKPANSTYLKGFNIYLSKSTTDPKRLLVRNLDEGFDVMTESGQVVYINADRLSSSTAWTDWIDYYRSGVKVPQVSFLEFSCPDLAAGTWWAFECKDVPSSNTYNVSPSGYCDLIGVRNSYDFGFVSGNGITIDFEGRCVGDYLRGEEVLNSYSDGSLNCSGLIDDTPKIYISGSFDGTILYNAKDYITIVGDDMHTYPRLQIGLYDSTRNFGFGVAHSLVKEPNIHYFVTLSWAMKSTIEDEDVLAEFRKFNEDGTIYISKTKQIYDGDVWLNVVCRNGAFTPGVGGVHVISFREPSATGKYFLKYVYWDDAVSTANDKVIDKYYGSNRCSGAPAYSENYWYILYHLGSSIYLDKWNDDMSSKIATYGISLSSPGTGYSPIEIPFAYIPSGLSDEYFVVVVRWTNGSTYKATVHSIRLTTRSEIDHLQLDYQNPAFAHFLLDRFYPPVIVFGWNDRFAAVKINTNGTLEKLVEKVVEGDPFSQFHISPTTGDLYFAGYAFPFLRTDDVGVSVPWEDHPAIYNGYFIGRYIYYVYGDAPGYFRRYDVITDSWVTLTELNFADDYYRYGTLIMIPAYTSWQITKKTAPVFFTKWNDSQSDNQIYLGVFLPTPSSITLYVDNDYQLHFDTDYGQSQVLPKHKLYNGVGFGDYCFNFDTIYSVVAGTSVETSSHLGHVFYKISGSAQIFAENPTIPLIYKSTDSGNTWVSTDKMAILKTGWDKATIEAHASSQESVEQYGLHPLIKSFPEITSVNVLENIANSLLDEYAEPYPYGAILVSGNTNLDIGKTFSIQSDRLGNYDDLMIKSYRHKFDKKLGFVTEIRFGQEEFNIAAEVAKLKESVFGGNIV